MLDKPKDDVVETARSRFQRFKDLNSTLREQAIEDTKFVMGDSDNQWQWPEDVYQNRASVSGKPCLTINVTAQHCNQIINNIRQNRPSAKISPVDGDADKKTALILGGMLRSIQSYSNADTAHDIAAEHAVYGGEGFWRVLTEYESEDSFDQVITIKPLINPQLVCIDPDCIEPDRSDAKWGMIFEDLTKEQFRQDYPDTDCSSWVEDPMGWNSKDKVRIAEYFYCEIEPDELYRLQDGTTLRKSEMPEGIKVEGDYVVTPDGLMIPIVAKRDTKKKVWYWCKLIGGEEKPVDKKVWPGLYLPIICVVGKEINVNGEIVRKGIVRDLKDSARMVNYSYSAAVETVALQNKVPYMASAESIAGFEDIWGAANIENRAYLPFNERDMEGNQLSMPQRQPSATMASAQVQMLQVSVEQMRATSGQSSANFGIKSEASSGIGIQRLKAQGEIATFHFPDNLARSLKYEAKVIIDLITKIYDTKRIVRILGLDGKESAAVIDPEMQMPYEEVRGAEGDVEAIFNPTVGRYDIAIDTGPSYQTQRQEAADALTELSNKNPQLMQFAGDILMRSYDFPMADELADRLAKTIPPELQDKKDGEPEIPPQVQQMMDQMGQQMEMMSQEMEANAAALQEKDQAIAAETLKAQQAQAKTLSLQIQLERDQAIKEIEDAQTQEGDGNNVGMELAKEQAIDERERMKIDMQQQTALKVEAMKIAGQIRVAKINARATKASSNPDEDYEDGMEDEFAFEEPEKKPNPIVEKLMAMHEEVIQQMATRDAILQQMANQAAQPKNAAITVVKNPDGSFSGQRTEI